MVLRQFSAACSWTSVCIGLSASMLGGCTTETTDKDIEFISGAELQRLVSEADRKPGAVLLIDPRAPADFAIAHLPNAWNKQLSTIPTGQKPDARLEAFDRLVVYGVHPGTPSAIGMTKRLLQNGYDDVYFYADGLEGWIAQGGQIETGRSKRWPTDQSTIID